LAREFGPEKSLPAFPTKERESLEAQEACVRIRTLNNTCAFTESRSKDPIGILEHAIFQTDDDELTALEPRFDEPANVLCVGQIQSSIDLVENVHWCYS
jgi:hypothetical protein